MADSQADTSESTLRADHPIASVRVLYSGRAEKHKELRIGSRLPQLWWVFFGRSWVPLPLQCFLIDHRDGLVLFVTGIDPAILSDPHPEYEWILREHIEIPSAKWRQITFEPTDDPLFEGFDGIHDVAGDGSMILMPTPGHTRGSMSLLIRQDGWDPILLVGDLTYEAALLEKNIVPGTGDKDVLLASFAKVRRLKQRLPGLAIVASHDFAAENLLSQATRHRSEN